MKPIVIQQPTTSQQLFLLFHGYGADAHDLAPVGEALAQAFPLAMVVSVAAPQPCEMAVAQGLQWFSLISAQGERETNPVVLSERVAQAVPGLVNTIHHWQSVASVGAAATALIGFSQGAMMALEASKGADLIAGRVIAHSGRYISLPTELSELVSVHLIHGKADMVVPYKHTLEAAETLQALSADFTADVLPHMGHTINDESIGLMIQRLQTHVPKRLWDEALQAAKHLK